MKYVAGSTGNMLLLTCVDDIDLEAATEMKKEIEKSENSIILDLQEKFNLNSDAIRQLVPCALSMRKKFKMFYLLNAEKSLKHTINSMGLETLLKCVQNLNEIDSAATPKATKKVDASFLNPFVEGAIHTLKLQCSTECIPLKPVPKDEGHDTLVEIAGVIGITSESFNGSISICFPEKTFLGVVGNMLGESYSEISQDVEDAAGELLNIIFGHAKKKLNEQGHALQKAIPTVVRGSKIRLKHMIQHQTFVLPFETEFGMFFIEISAEKQD